MRGWVLGAFALLAGVTVWLAVAPEGAPRVPPPPAPVSESPSISAPVTLALAQPAPAEPSVAVDLDALRTRMPQNRYWTGLRSAEPELAGKIASGTATEEEIARHFADRRAISEDAIAFARAVLDEYGEALPQRGLYELSIELHRARLADLPRDLAAAEARRQKQIAARRAAR
jgi:hypothetical protein